MKRAKVSELVGKRVQIPAYTDEWMQGDRYGTVMRTSMSATHKMVAHVMLDKSNRTRKFLAADCDIVDKA